MKALIVVDHAVGITGPHRNVVGTLNALGSRSDIEVDLLTSKVDPSEPYFKAPNIKIHLDFDPNVATRLPANLIALIRLARRCEIIYVPSGLKALLLANFARILTSKPLISGPNVTHLPIRKADSPGRIEISFLTDQWLEASRARTEHVRNHLDSKLGQKVAQLPHAIDTLKFSPEKRDLTIWPKLGLKEQTLKIIYVGRDNEPLKGLSQLMDAAEILLKKYPGQLQFALVGQMSKETQRRAHATNGGVHCLGFRKGDELAALYASADLSVISSSWENFPFVALEAIASGLAVVASKTGGIPEIIEDGCNGVLVDCVGPDGRHLPETGALFAEAISRLVQDRELLEKLRTHSRQKALEEFSEKALGDRIHNLFHRRLNHV